MCNYCAILSSERRIKAIHSDSSSSLSYVKSIIFRQMLQYRRLVFPTHVNLVNVNLTIRTPTAAPDRTYVPWCVFPELITSKIWLPYFTAHETYFILFNLWRFAADKEGTYTTTKQSQTVATNNSARQGNCIFYHEVELLQGADNTWFIWLQTRIKCIIENV
jgi:hypothetical protein